MNIYEFFITEKTKEGKPAVIPFLVAETTKVKAKTKIAKVFKKQGYKITGGNCIISNR